jgi:hypothetical protein
MSSATATGEGATRRARLWFAAWILAAIAYAAPLAWHAYHDLVEVNYRARVRLIEQHRLWEVDNYRGKPQSWTRFAGRILTDQQLLRRLAVKYAGQSEEIEREYRRDLAIARAEVIIVAGAWWAGPVMALYGLLWLVRRRRPRNAPKPAPASASDPRYRPPG